MAIIIIIMIFLLIYLFYQFPPRLTLSILYSLSFSTQSHVSSAGREASPESHPCRLPRPVRALRHISGHCPHPAAQSVAIPSDEGGELCWTWFFAEHVVHNQHQPCRFFMSWATPLGWKAAQLLAGIMPSSPAGSCREGDLWLVPASPRQPWLASG